MKVRATKVSNYVRRVDGIFGKVERFDLVHEHRVQIQIGNRYFVSTRTYSTEADARRAAKRMETHHAD